MTRTDMITRIEELLGNKGSAEAARVLNVLLTERHVSVFLNGYHFTKSYYALSDREWFGLLDRPLYKGKERAR